MKVKRLSRLGASIKTAIASKVKPLLAQDAALPDIRPALQGVTKKTIKKEVVAKQIFDIVKPKLATDADLEMPEIIELIETLTGDEDMDEPAMDSPTDEIMRLCSGLSEEDKARISELLKSMAVPAQDTTPPEAPEGGAPKPGEKAMDKKAMDEAIAAATKKAAEETEASTVKRMNAIREAEREVRPLVGDITVAMDSAEAIYKFALEQAKEDLNGVEPSAYRSIVKHLVKLKQEPVTTPRIATDAATVKSISEKYPGINRCTRSAV